MPRYETMEYFPLQILSFGDLEGILEGVIGSYTQAWSTRVAEAEWRKLAGLVRKALEEVYLLGPQVKNRWLKEVDERLARNERKRSKRALREIRVGYLNLLDQIYGAIFRHVLTHVPTALPVASGHFHLSRLTIFRYARLRDTEAKPALEELMELIYLGGPHFEAELAWQPLGEELEEVEEPRRRRHGLQ